MKGDGSRREISARRRGSSARFFTGVHRASKWGTNAPNREWHRKPETYVSSKDRGRLLLCHTSLSNRLGAWLGSKHTFTLLSEKTPTPGASLLLLAAQAPARRQAEGRHAFKEHHKSPGAARGSEDPMLSPVRATSGSQRSQGLVGKTRARQVIPAALGGEAMAL